MVFEILWSQMYLEKFSHRVCKSLKTKSTCSNLSTCAVLLCAPLTALEFSSLNSSQLPLAEARTCFGGFQRLGHHTGYWVLVYYKVEM